MNRPIIPTLFCPCNLPRRSHHCLIGRIWRSKTENNTCNLSKVRFSASADRRVANPHSRKAAPVSEPRTSLQKHRLRLEARQKAQKESERANLDRRLCDSDHWNRHISVVGVAAEVAGSI